MVDAATGKPIERVAVRLRMDSGASPEWPDYVLSRIGGCTGPDGRVEIHVGLGEECLYSVNAFSEKVGYGSEEVTLKAGDKKKVRLSRPRP